VYLGLPDGGLAEEALALDEATTNVVEDFKPDRIYTTGADGYDLHPDHIIMHDSTVRAIRLLGDFGLYAASYGLDSRHQGELAVPNSRLKLGAIAMHASQRVTENLARWGDTELYTPLITGDERYVPIFDM
jgi:LmbE family N-acetylglucosaminyl deacetylase